MTKNLSPELADSLQEKIYNDNFSKPGIPTSLRKSCLILQKKLGAMINISSTKTGSTFEERFNITYTTKTLIELNLKSCSKSKLIKHPSTMVHYYTMRSSIKQASEQHDEDFAKSIEAFLNSVERLIGKDFVFLCEDLGNNQFLFAFESGSLKISAEIVLSL